MKQWGYRPQNAFYGSEQFNSQRCSSNPFTKTPHTWGICLPKYTDISYFCRIYWLHPSLHTARSLSFHRMHRVKMFAYGSRAQNQRVLQLLWMQSPFLCFSCSKPTWQFISSFSLSKRLTKKRLLEADNSNWNIIYTYEVAEKGMMPLVFKITNTKTVTKSNRTLLPWKLSLVNCFSGRPQTQYAVKPFH